MVGRRLWGLLRIPGVEGVVEEGWTDVSFPPDSSLGTERGRRVVSDASPRCLRPTCGSTGPQECGSEGSVRLCLSPVRPPVPLPVTVCGPVRKRPGSGLPLWGSPLSLLPGILSCFRSEEGWGRGVETQVRASD